MSQRVGIALGLTNVLLRNLIQKGYIRVSNATWKRRLYSLTPEGLSHKMHLTVGYIRRVVSHYRKVRETLRSELSILGLHAESRVAVYGNGEFAELVFLGLKELGIEEIEVFSNEPASDGKFLGMPVQPISHLNGENFDVVMVADLEGKSEALAELSKLDVAPSKSITFFDSPRERDQADLEEQGSEEAA